MGNILNLRPYSGERAARRARRQLRVGDAFANAYYLGTLLAREPELAEAFIAGVCAAATVPHGVGASAEAVDRCFTVLDGTIKRANKGRRILR